METQTEVLDKTRKILDQFEDVEIDVEKKKKIRIPEELRKTPRTGYLVRARKAKLKITIPSVYDHILKLAFSIDMVIQAQKFKYDTELLARFCAFHDFAEAIVGDHPVFTNKKMAGRHFIDEDEKVPEEERTNKLIAESLEGVLKELFEGTMKILSEGDIKEISELEFFRYMDKAEVLLTLWQYIFQERAEMGSVDKFVKLMEDFFEYPLIRFTFNDQTYKIAKFLQDIIKYKDYYAVGREPFYESGYSGFNYTFMLEFIEKTKIHIEKSDESLKRPYQD